MASALRSVCEQTLDPSRYEVIVVDNNSTDETKRYTVDVSRTFSHIRYCFEEKQGLSYSRNTGYQTARGQYIAYIDDDCTVPKNWLYLAQEIIEQIGPAMFGGPYRPFYNATKPQWYHDKYGSYDVGTAAKELARDEYLCGTNMFFRRNLLEQLGGFSTEVGMMGDRLGYGEETVIQRRICKEHPQEVIYYDPRLIVSHLVRPEKMSIFWCAKQMFVSGRAWQRVLNQTDHSHTHTWFRSFIRMGRAVLLLLKKLVHGMVARDRSRYPFLANYFYEVAFIQIQTLGSAYEQLTSRSNRG